MAELIFIFLFAIPAILGLAEILHTVKLWILSGRETSERILIIVPDNEVFQKQLLKTYEEARWQGENFARKIVVVDSCLNEENKHECEKLVQRLGFCLCSKSQLLDVID